MTRRRSARSSSTLSRARRARGARSLTQQPARVQISTTKVAHVLTAMRRDSLSLSAAARAQRVDPRTVVRLAGRALRKDPHGRYLVAAHDRVPRLVRLPTPDGLIEIDLADSRDAQIAAQYWIAVHAYVSTGDTDALVSFEGVSVHDAEGNPVTLMTDRGTLDHLAHAGVLSFESIYARVV
jgi:hypothetical protein